METIWENPSIATGQSLGWDAGVLAGIDPLASAAGIWVQPQAPGEDSVGLVREAFQGDSLPGSTEISLPSILLPSHPKKSI